MHTLTGRRSPMSVCLAVLCIAITASLHAELIPVRHPQGSAHGFLALKTVKGIIIATGDVTQVTHGDRVTSRVTFHFRDGSLDDDTTVFSQRRVFRLISDHHIQRGPSFPKPSDISSMRSPGRLRRAPKTERLLKTILIFLPTSPMVFRLIFY
jgi:hypothetical protein